jgi:hypothetical protein
MTVRRTQQCSLALVRLPLLDVILLMESQIASAINEPGGATSEANNTVGSMRICLLLPYPAQRETHCAFPADYKSTTRALLLAHQRLQRPDLQAAAAAAAEARRTLTEVMCCMFR